MTGRGRSIVGWVVALGLVGGAVLVFLRFFEKHSFEVPVGLRGEAALNKYLAAERLLVAMGLETRSFESPRALGTLPSLDGTLILPTQRHTLDEESSLALVEWAEAGGHLVVLTWTLWDEEEREPDPILDPLGVRQFMLAAPEEEDAEPDDAEPAEGNGGAPAVAPSRTLVPDVVAQVAVAERDGPLEILFDPSFTMEDAEERAIWSASDVNGTHLLQFRVGAGYVTALTDDYFLTNDRIAQHDHAELIYRLAVVGGRAGPVWLVYREDWPRPVGLLVDAAWMALISLAVLVGVWIWSSSRRFGPLRPDEPLARRRLMEHVEASGRFFWRHGEERALLDSVRAALLERVRVRHPAWLGLEPRELNLRLARLSGIPREKIDQALAFRLDRQSERFAQHVATLETIRKSL